MHDTVACTAQIVGQRLDTTRIPVTLGVQGVLVAGQANVRACVNAIVALIAQGPLHRR